MQGILQRFTFFSLLHVHGDDIIMHPAIVIFPQAGYSYYIVLTDCSSYVSTEIRIIYSVKKIFSFSEFCIS